MDFILLTTSIVKGGIPAVLERMLASVQDNAAPTRTIRLLLLLQNVDEATRLPAMPDVVEVITDKRILSLSAARNILIEHARNHFTERTIVAFPDDDCCYPAGLLDNLDGLFSASGTLDFAFCRYASTAIPVSDIEPLLRPADAKAVVRNASSNTLFIRGSVVAQMGLFDTNLGVGTPNNGGEDVEYALRAFRTGRQSTYVDAELVGHRDKSADLRAKYYAGSLLAIRRHAPHHGGACVEYLRKLAVGLALVAKGELSFGRYVRAITTVPRPLPVSAK